MTCGTNTKVLHRLHIDFKLKMWISCMVFYFLAITNLFGNVVNRHRGYKYAGPGCWYQWLQENGKLVEMETCCNFKFYNSPLEARIVTVKYYASPKGWCNEYRIYNKTCCPSTPPLSLINLMD